MEWERKTWWDEYMAGERIVEIAERHRVSRKTLYKWLERYEAHGMEGLRELSRAPLAHPRQVGDLWRERVRSAAARASAVGAVGSCNVAAKKAA